MKYRLTGEEMELLAMHRAKLDAKLEIVSEKKAELEEEADWVEEGDSVLKAKIAVQFDVTFEGGIYADSTKKAVEIGNIQNGG